MLYYLLLKAMNEFKGLSLVFSPSRLPRVVEERVGVGAMVAALVALVVAGF